MVNFVLIVAFFLSAIGAIRLGERFPAHQPALQFLAGLFLIAGLALIGFGLGAIQRMAGSESPTGP